MPAYAVGLYHIIAYYVAHTSYLVHRFAARRRASGNMFPVAVCSTNTTSTRITRRSSIHTVFQAIVINRISHASPAWWRFASADDRHRLEVFLRRSARLGYRANSSTTFASICDDADDQLFERITSNSQHLLHRLLPSEREQHYSLRERSHNSA